MAIGSTGNAGERLPGMEQNFKGKGFQPGHPYYEGSGNKPGCKLPDLSQEAKRQRQMELIRYLLGGATLKEAAKIMNLHIATVSSYVKDPEVRQQLRELHSGMVEQLDLQVIQSLRSKTELVDECAWLALDRMKEILEDKTAHPSIVAKMIDSALDRTPELSRTKKLDITERKLTYTGEDLLQAVQVMGEIEQRQQERTTRDVTPKEPSE